MATPRSRRASASSIMVATDRLLVAGMHMHFPGFLNLNRRTDGGYELVPEIWQQAL